MNADEERAMRAVIASAPDQYARPHQSTPVNQPRRCECHDCTQTRIPLFERQMLQRQTVPAEFYMGAEALEPKNLALRAERHDEEIRAAERERCAKIAEEAAQNYDRVLDVISKHETFAWAMNDMDEGINEQFFGAVRYLAEIAARIRSGE